MKRTLLACVFLPVILIFSSCDGSDRQDPIPMAKVGPSLYLIGNDRGMLRPCGCSKPVLGGIERRLSLLRSLDREAMKRSAVFAFGNIVVDAGRQQEMKLEAFMEFMNEAGVKAYAVGDEDLVVGMDYWVHTCSQLARFPLVSLNIEKDGSRVFETHASIEVNGENWVVTAFASPKTTKVTEPGVTIRPDPDVSPVLKALENSACLILFGTGSRQELLDFAEGRGLLEGVRRAVLVRTGVSDTPSVQVERSGVISLELGTKGRDVAALALERDLELTRHTLGESRGVDSDASEILNYYRDSVREENLLAMSPRFGQAPGRYAGSESCARCHEAAHATWKASRHGTAWQTLVNVGEHHDPECVKCHVTGFGLHGGFDPAKSLPVDVQCEACHGPSADHVEKLLPTPGGRLGPNSCNRCHDLANSPKFTFGVYWPRIAHDRR